MRTRALICVGVVALTGAACSGGGLPSAGRATTTSQGPASTSTTSATGASSTTASSTTVLQPPTGTSTQPLPSGPTVTLSNWTGVEPSTFYFSGDSGNIVTGITWSSWTPTSAVGSGTWGYNDCTPDCAGGKVTPYQATITLSEPSGGNFTKLVEQQSGPYGQLQTFTLPSHYIGGPS